MNFLATAWAIALAAPPGSFTPETTIDPNPIAFPTRQCQITLVIQQDTQKLACKEVVLTQGRYNANLHFNVEGEKSGLTFLTQQDFLISGQDVAPKQADTAVLGVVLRKPAQAPRILAAWGWCSLTQTRVSCRTSTGEDFYVGEAEP